MWWLIGGGVLMVLGIIMLFGVRYERRRKEEVMFLSTSNIAALLEMHAHIKERASVETLCERCAIIGIIDALESAQEPPSLPQESQGSSASVLYKTSIQKKDAEGNVVKTIKQKDAKSRFWVRDDTGRILVDPLSANIELSRKATYDSEQETRIEEALKVGQSVYILGWLSDVHGQPMIANKGFTQPDAVNTSYIITWRSQQSLKNMIKESEDALFWVGWALVVLGLILVGVGLWL